MLDEETILNDIDPCLNDENELSKDDFYSLFSDLTSQQQSYIEGSIVS